MLKTRSTDRRQEVSEVKGTKPRSIVENAAAATAAAATKNIQSKKNQKQTVEIVKPKCSVQSKRVVIDNSAAAKPKRLGSTVDDGLSAKIKKTIAKNVELMEVKTAKSPKSAAIVKVEVDSQSEATASVPPKKTQTLVQTTLWGGGAMSKQPASVKTSQRRSQKIGKSMIIETLEESEPILTSYQKKIQQQKDALHKVEEKVKRSTVARSKAAMKKASAKKSKSSPKKSLLREQLKLQLETQRELLRVQQEIFEKANKAQNDIFKLISVLGDDDDDSDEDEEDAEEAEEEQEEREEQEEQEEDDDGESKPLPTRIFESSAIEEPEDILGLDPVEMEVVDEGKFSEQTNYEDGSQMNMVVVLQSEEGEQEYELYEIFDSADEKKGSQTHYEIVEGDDQDIQCRAVDSKGEQPEIYMPIDFNESSDPLTSTRSQPKHPVHVQLPEVNVPRAGPKTEKTDLLNKSNMSEKQLNEYIRYMINSAEPNADGKFQCTICNEVVSNRYSLGPHVMRVHSKHKSKVCPFCDRAFTCTGDLTRHIRIHTNSKPFKCTYPGCTYAFRASGDLHKHLRRHQTVQDGSNRRFACDLCDRSFERNYDLKRHKMTHNRHEEGVGYQCEYCPKTFVRKDQHRAHTYRHLGIKPYKCPDCDRSFGDFSNCSKHIKLNACKDVSDANAMGRFTCDICLKRFKSKAGIKLHVTKCSQQSALCKEIIG